jgi:hypothetical protein
VSPDDGQHWWQQYGQIIWQLTQKPLDMTATTLRQ